MHEASFFSKTARGLAELSRRKATISAAAAAVLALVDGKSNHAQLLTRTAGMNPADFEAALSELLREGFIRALENPADLISSGKEEHISVAELDPEEGVRAWAEARRCSSALKDSGFYASNVHRLAADRQPTVLIVEDTLSVAQMETALLEAEGFAAHHAVDGRNAQTLLRTMTPDLVILDINLPDITGFRILETLRKHPRFKDLAVIMVTSRIGEQDVMEGLRLGADGYIFKPLKPESLTACVRQVLGLRPAKT